jgi:branched-chain amino acid transport system substrate-binding protein
MIKSFKPVLAAAAVTIAMLGQPACRRSGRAVLPAGDFVSSWSLWMPTGQAVVFGGFIDYLNYVNLKEKGVNGVMMSYEECETEYNNAKGVECYERLKSQGGQGFLGPAAHDVDWRFLRVDR